MVILYFLNLAVGYRSRTYFLACLQYEFTYSVLRARRKDLNHFIPVVPLLFGQYESPDWQWIISFPMKALVIEAGDMTFRVADKD